MVSKEMREILEGSNLLFARELLIKNMSGGVYPNELVRLLNAFVNGPSVDTASELIGAYPDLIASFQLARRGGYTERLYQAGGLKPRDTKGEK